MATFSQVLFDAIFFQMYDGFQDWEPPPSDEEITDDELHGDVANKTSDLEARATEEDDLVIDSATDRTVCNN